MTMSRDPDALIERAGLSGDPAADQHFLIDDRVLDRLPSHLPSDADTSHVVEIGAGTGGLTDRLLSVADRVTAIERDPRLVEFLREEFADAIATEQLTVREGDVLEMTFPESATASVSNLPYSASSEILFQLLVESIPLVVMVQREFADRLVADPDTDDYGRLSVTAGHYADSEIVEPVPREAFSPQPAVQSAIVRLTPRDPAYSVPDDSFFLQFVTAVFTQRRKTLRNAIRNTTHISSIQDATAVLEALDADLLRRRPGKLSPERFAELSSVAYDTGDPQRATNE